MYKSYKPKNNTYIDSSGIVKGKKVLNNFLVGEIVTISKSINIINANTWYDTGIDGSYMTSGTYIIELYINSYSSNGQYWERLSGVMAWYSGVSNSDNFDEIPLSKAGHARNNRNIKLRIQRQRRPNYIKLQICDSMGWSSAGDVSFSFRKII